ncbi:MAG: hypothetical protein V4850_35565 [Myxococcota bacterium]
MYIGSRWPDLAPALQALAPAGSGLTVRAITPGEVAELIANLRAWYPALAVAAVSYMLDPAFYAEQVAFAGETPPFAERPYLVVVVESASEMVSCLLLAAEEEGRVVSGTMTVVAPGAYGKGLGGVSARGTVGVAEAIGADLAYALAALDNHASRKALEAAGMSLCAVVPGCERKLLASGEVVWVAEALYVKAFAPEEERVKPAASLLTPAVAAMFAALTSAEAPTFAAKGATTAVRATAIDAGCCFVSLRDLDAQRTAEAAGLVPLGLVAGSDRHQVSEAVAFGYDALYGRPSDSFEGHVWPELGGLPPRLAALTALVRASPPRRDSGRAPAA